MSTAYENFWKEIASWPGRFFYMRVDDRKYKTFYVDAEKLEMMLKLQGLCVKKLKSL